nr:CvpA family protein [uncultured Gammaproteobacteria bacterium]
MTWVDYAILITVGVSALRGWARGLIREVFSLIGWIAALWIGFYGSPVLAVELKSWIAYPGVPTVVAFVILFLSTLFLSKTLGLLLSAWINRSLLGSVNRLGGLLLGWARGLALILGFVWAADSLKLSQQTWWQQSRFLPSLELWVETLQTLYLKDRSRHFLTQT